MQPGDLIKWFEVYGDINILRDSGLGIIISKYDYEFQGWKTTIFKVYRIEQQDTISLEECCIERIKGVKYES